MIEVTFNTPFTDYEKIEKEFNELRNGEIKINAPELIQKLVWVLKKFRYNSLAINSVLSIVLVKLSQAITAKRIKYKEVSADGFPNFYAISFVPSGYGKDRLCNDLDKYFLKYYYYWFDNKVENHIENRKQEIRKKSYEKYPDSRQERLRKQYENEEVKKIRYLIPEVSDGTREGFHADAKAFSDAGFGSLLVKISEFGSFLNDATSEQKLFLNQLFEAYTGKVVAKSIKSEGREKNIENLPINALLFSDPTIFQCDLKKQFHLLMESGLGRRSIITFQPKREKYEIENDAKKALKNEELFYNFLDFLAEEFMKIFNQIEFNAEYQLQEKTYLEVFYSYHLKIQSKINEDENSLISKEIASRELKVIKLSCLYACLNHTKELVINPVDMEQAIDTIEMLATDFKKFLNYKPKYTDKYDNLFNFFAENEGKQFTKTELINNHYLEFGTSRDKARYYFDEYIEVLREIATSKGYYLLEENINRNSGRAYTLKKFNKEESDFNLKEIDKIIKNTNDYEIGYDDFEYKL